jgi:hypothetical protein
MNPHSLLKWAPAGAEPSLRNRPARGSRSVSLTKPLPPRGSAWDGGVAVRGRERSAKGRIRGWRVWGVVGRMVLGEPARRCSDEGEVRGDVARGRCGWTVAEGKDRKRACSGSLRPRPSRASVLYCRTYVQQYVSTAVRRVGRLAGRLASPHARPPSGLRPIACRAGAGRGGGAMLGARGLLCVAG